MSSEFPLPYVREVPGNRRRCGHHRAHQMGAAPATLASFKIPVAGGGATLAGLQNIGIHSQTHRASGLAPLETRVQKNLMQSFLFGRALHRLRSRHHHGSDRRTHMITLSDTRRGAHILEPENPRHYSTERSHFPHARPTRMPLTKANVVSSGAIIPARAPASMLILQSVMRPSIDKPRTAPPAYSITCPVAPSVPICPIIPSAKSLAVTPSANDP